MPASDPPLGHPRIVKLVRDHVAELLPDLAVTFAKVDSQEVLRQLLRAKLIEEAAEYLRNPSLEELADIQEALYALCAIDLGKGIGDLEEETEAKRKERGGYMDGIGMYAFTRQGQA
jgi:predicted house-cleaning noncanonical NTP pyrophosphatase (MazG superfamily)